MKFLFIVLIFGLLHSCTKNVIKSDTLVLSLPTDVSTLDPAGCYDTICFVPVAQVYETLFEIEYLKRPYTIRPVIAQGLPEVAPNKLKYTFKIKSGIPYHTNPSLPEGRKVRAVDFVNAIKRLAFQGTNSRGWWLFENKVKGLNEWRTKVNSDINLFFSEPVAGLSAPDDETLVIELNRPYPQLLWAMSLTFTAPIPEEAIRALQNDFGMTTVGTGPYMVTRYNPAQEVILKKNPQYISSTYPTEGDKIPTDMGLLKDKGAKLPFIENVQMKVIKETQTDWLNFQSKKIDIIHLKDQFQSAIDPDGKLKPELVKEGVELQASPTLIYWWIGFNMKDPIVGKNLNLRKAIAFGVNIDKFNELFNYNMAKVANSIYPPGIPGYSPNKKLPYSYNFETAKEYLKKAGYPEGKGAPTLFYDIRGTDTRKRQMGEFIQQELNKLGVTVEIRINTFPAFLEKARKGELQFWQANWSLDYPDAENVLQILSSANLPPGNNYYQYSNPAFDKIFNEIKEIEDGPKKTALMEKIEEIVNTDLPWVMQYYSQNYMLHHKRLKNFWYSDIVYNNVKYLKLEETK